MDPFSLLLAFPLADLCCWWWQGLSGAWLAWLNMQMAIIHVVLFANAAGVIFTRPRSEHRSLSDDDPTMVQLAEAHVA